MIYQCMIVDDEPPAHKVLESYIDKLEVLNLAGNCYSAVEAINFLQKQKVDILFLDIEMPDFSGLEMLRVLNNPPHIILTTAYSQFALESYELGVIDYLLKPIRFERFAKAVQKIMPKTPEVNTGHNYVFIKTSGERVRVFFDDVSHLEAYGNFVKIHTLQDVLLAPGTLVEIAGRFPQQSFVRIHRSFVVNANKVQKISGNEVFLPKEKLTMSQSYKKILFSVLGLKEGN